MKSKVLYLVVFISVSIVLTSCSKFFIEGNGMVKEETRELGQFDKVANEGSFEVEIIRDSSFYVIVKAESNLLNLVSTDINSGALIINTRENVNNTRPIKLEVHVPEIKALEMNGSGFIRFYGFETESFSAVINGSGNISGSMVSEEAWLKTDGSGSFNLDMDAGNVEAIISGSGNIVIEGSGDFVQADIKGSGNVKALNFEALKSELDIYGSGNVYINASQYLDAEIMGSGSVYYIGNPQVNTTILGSGRVLRY